MARTMSGPPGSPSERPEWWPMKEIEAWAGAGVCGGGRLGGPLWPLHGKWATGGEEADGGGAFLNVLTHLHS